LATTVSISANALSVWPLLCSAAARVIVASSRSLSGVAGLSISALQTSISFAGSAPESAAQTTGGSADVSALAPADVRIARATAALAANGEMNDRRFGSAND
jgi:hypothetical protein